MAQLSKTLKRTDHEFRTHAPEAKEAFLAGSFNEWNPKAIPMRANDGGDWTVTLQLAPGRYEYKYVLDGEWRCQEACEGSHLGCPHCTPNDFGTRNCVLEIH